MVSVGERLPVAGDQSQAMEGLSRGVERGERMQTLVGVTGSGKTLTMANVIQQVQRPTVVIARHGLLTATMSKEVSNDSRAGSR